MEGGESDVGLYGMFGPFFCGRRMFGVGMCGMGLLIVIKIPTVGNLTV